VTDVTVPEATESNVTGFVSLRSGTTRLLATRGYAGSSAEAVPLAGREPSGVIYTDRADMPSLEELLEQNRVAYAVLERSAPAPAQDSTGIGTVVASVVVGAVGAVGWTLFAVAVSEGGIRPNPYTALLLGLGAFVLLATLIVGLRSKRARS
jgi:hypothetical protein